MLKLIFSGLFLLFALVFLLIGMLRGKKYKFQYPLSKLITVSIAAVLAVLASRLLAKLLVSFVAKIVLTSFSDSQDVLQLLEKVPSAMAAVHALAAMIVAPGLFFLIFLIQKP